jgi:hypothetical protein
MNLVITNGISAMMTNQLLQPQCCAALLQTMMPADRRRWMLKKLHQPSTRATPPNGMCVIWLPFRCPRKTSTRTTLRPIALTMRRASLSSCRTRWRVSTRTSLLHAGFQKQFMHAVDAADVQRPPSVGSSAYSSEEVKWCQATFDFLTCQLDEEGRAKRNLPPKRRGRGPARGGPAPPTPTMPTEGPNDTENEDDMPLLSRRPAKRARKSKYR